MARGWVGHLDLGFILASDVPTRRGRGLCQGCPREEAVALLDVPIMEQSHPSSVPPLETSARPLPPGQQRVKSFCFRGNTVYIMSMNKRWLC